MITFTGLPPLGLSETKDGSEVVYGQGVVSNMKIDLGV